MACIFGQVGFLGPPYHGSRCVLVRSYISYISSFFFVFHFYSCCFCFVWTCLFPFFTPDLLITIFEIRSLIDPSNRVDFLFFSFFLGFSLCVVESSKAAYHCYHHHSSSPLLSVVIVNSTPVLRYHLLFFFS